MLLTDIAAVYERLGLGPPTSTPLSGRVGCTKVLEIPNLRDGWAKLVGAIDAARANTHSIPAGPDLLVAANEWLALSAAALVIETAHRGTKPHCLTFGALCLHPLAMVISDKNDGDRIQSRAIPKTARMRAILSGSLECHEIIRERCLSDTHRSISPHDPVFVAWHQDSENGLAATPLETAAIAAVTRRFFGSEANFGRSQWVTYCDQFRVNRWFIRLLTGHARDVSRVDGPYFDTPPVEACRQAQEVLQAVGNQIFGTCVPKSAPCWTPQFALVASASGDQREFSDRVPDPRTLLTPISTDTLVGWRIGKMLQERLFAGLIDAGTDVLAVLHQVLVCQVPDFDTAVAAVCEPARCTKLYGACVGVLWDRDHFVHPTWIPVRPTTATLIDRALEAGPLSAGAIRNHVAEALGRLDFVSFPPGKRARIDALMSVAASFRRVEFPTSLNAQAHPLVPAPALSHLSLMRLADIQLNPLPFHATQKQRKGCHEKGEDVAFLKKVLAHVADTRLKHGQTQKRAGKCLRQLTQAPVVWTPWGDWLLEITKDQLTITYKDPRNGFKLSSWYTYFCTITAADVDQYDDPRQWGEHEWHEWMDRLDAVCRRADGEPTQRNLSERRIPARERVICDRAKHALWAVVDSVQRMQQHVPLTVRQRLQLSTTSITRYGSASATIILDADHAEVDALLEGAHRDHPAHLALIRFRTELGRIVPVRTGECSSARRDCLTPANAIVFETVGYDLHKTNAAVRAVPLSSDEAGRLRCRLDEIEKHFGSQLLACRLDGSPDAGYRDSRLVRDYSQALKSATGDRSAREHSQRAATMQRITWPDWQRLAQKLLAGEVTPLMAAQWSATLDKDWLRTARAFSAAGHADLRAGMGSYLAAWPLVYALRANVTVTGVRVRPRFLKQLGINPDALRSARARGTQATHTPISRKAPSQVADDAQVLFDEIEWVSNECRKRNLLRWNCAPTATGTQWEGTTESAQSMRVPSAAAALPQDQQAPVAASAVNVKYLTLRALGLPRERAMERLDIPARQAMAVEGLIPGDLRVAASTRRAQWAPSKRGDAADIETVFTPTAAAALTWLVRLPRMEFEQLCETFHNESLPLDHLAFWSRLKATIPSGIRIELRIGKRYLAPETISGYDDLAPAIRLTVDKRIGEKTITSIYVDPGNNKVRAARLTAVVKVLALALKSLRA